MWLFVKKWWYIILAGILVILFLVIRVKIERSKLYSIISKILNKRDKVEKEIEVRKELARENINKIDKEYEKKKKEVEERVENRFREMKEKGLLDDLALRLFGNEQSGKKDKKVRL